MPESVLDRFRITHILVFSLAYGATIGLADLLPSSANLVLALWPAGGIGLASLLLLPRRLWPAMIAAFSVTGFAMAMVIGRSAPASLGFALANATESTLCALALTRRGVESHDLGKVGAIASLVFCAVVVNACTAVIGAATAALVSGMSFTHFWFSWWVVDGISILLVTPLFLALAGRKDVTGAFPRRTPAEYSAFFLVWTVFVWLAFNSTNPLSGRSPHPYLLIVLLAWPAIRFGPRALSATLLVLAAITVSSHAILAGPSPLLGQSTAVRLLFAQSFLAITIITTWLMFASFAERRAAEAKLLEQYAMLGRMNRELRAISDCNQTLMRAVDEKALLVDVCRIVCDGAGYRFAWVGYAERDAAKVVRPMAWAGVEDGYLADGEISWADTPRGSGPTGRAIRTGESVCIQDFEADHAAAPWRANALRRGYHSGIALPLKEAGVGTFGALNIYSVERNAFTPDEIRLLEELAGDLAFGINTLRTRTQHREAEDEREKLQGQLAQAQKMESIGRLAGGVAHDFNNMLGVILGHAGLALKQVGPTQPMHSNLQEIRKAAERSADLTRQLLAFAKKQTVAPRVLDLNETVKGMLNMLRRLIGEDIDLAWVPGQAIWPVKVDPSQIDQVLANLCVNARDAIEGVGRITIETQTATFDEAHGTHHAICLPGEYVMLAVSDDGSGMDALTMDRLFEPFFTTKEVGKGTGLGLATVYGIVRQNDGFINVYSEPGRGSTFKIYLPRHKGEAGSPRQEGAMEPASRGNETILLVEDEPALLRLTRLMLDALGYRTLAANSPGEAMRLARAHTSPIHLLLTDVVMPEMTGQDLAGQLQSIHPKIIRLFMSGYTANIIAPHGVLDEGVHFLQKPFSIEALAAKVREALDDGE